ncbi:MAG TPA: hypothetical protein VHN14_14245 [Kofleriaceae bacterium]|jgi:hypothetical protein|nr:hypothetical protein [Kofleriaceae bacterium]
MDRTLSHRAAAARPQPVQKTFPDEKNFRERTMKIAGSRNWRVHATRASAGVAVV